MEETDHLLSSENNKERLAESVSRITEDKAVEWDGIDYYPPLGCEIEVHNDNGYTLLYGHSVIGSRGEVKSVYKSGAYDVVVVEIDGNGYCFRIEMVRPVKTPKEIQVDRMTRVLPSRPTTLACQEDKRCCELLYDAGYRIIKE